MLNHTWSSEVEKEKKSKAQISGEKITKIYNRAEYIDKKLAVINSVENYVFDLIAAGDVSDEESSESAV